MSKWNFQFFTPFILLFLIFIDGQLNQILHTLVGNTMFPVLHLFLIVLIYSTSKLSLRYLILITILLGLVYDSYYIGVWGGAASAFPLISLFIFEMRETVFHSYLTRLSTIIIAVFIFEVALPLIQIAAGLVSVPIFAFISQELAPTLILNLALTAVLILPLDRLYGFRKGISAPVKD